MWARSTSSSTYRAIPRQLSRVATAPHPPLAPALKIASSATAQAHQATTTTSGIRLLPQTHRRTMATNGNQAQALRLQNPTIFICDMQEKFQSAIHEFDKIVLTTQKLLTFANSFSIPVHATTQTVAKLGPTVPALADLLPSSPHDKTKFSMHIPAITALLPPASSVALVGIESHICITQTAIDLRDAGHKVYVLADGVSSCNKAEVGVALDRLRSEPGVTVTTSESWMYECVGDASHAGFRGLIGVVKNSSADTKKVLDALPPKI